MAQEKVQRLILTGPEVWSEWKTQLEVYAASIRAQGYLVVSETDNVDKYNTVREPTIPSSVTEDSARLYHLQREVFTIEDQRIQKLNDFIATTISPSYLTFLVGQPSPYGRVQALVEHLEPDSVDRDAVIQSHIQNLGSSLPKHTDIDKWLSEWESLAQKADGTIWGTGYRMQTAFLVSIQKQYPEFYASWSGDVQKKLSTATLKKIMANFRVARYGIAQNLTIIPGTAPMSFATDSGPPPTTGRQKGRGGNKGSSNNNERGRKREGRKREPGKDGNCWCGFLHRYADCYVMNPLKRPDGFIVTQAKLDSLNTLIDGSNCRQAVERAIGHPIPRTANPDNNSPNANALHPDLVLPASFATSFALTSQTGYADHDSDHDTEIEEVYRDSIPQTMPQSTYEASFPEFISLFSKVPTGPNTAYRNWTIFDSGTICHVYHDPNVFRDFVPFNKAHYIYHGDSCSLIQGYGTVHIIGMKWDGTEGVITLNNALLVPNFLANIVSMDIVKSKGVIWDHDTDWLITRDANRTPIWKIMNDHGHNFLSVKPPLPSDTNSDICRPTTDVASYAAASNNPHVAAATAEVWHRRLGHPGPMITQNFKKNVLGVIVEGRLPDGLCDTCVKSKITQKISRRPIPMPQNNCERLHYDLVDFGANKTFGNHRYLNHFYCSLSKSHIVDTAKDKEEMTQLTIIQNACKLVKRAGYRVKFLQCDNEKGLGNEVKAWLKKKGIKIEPSVPYAPNQNGTAERSGNIIVKVARALSIFAGLPHALWPFLVKTAAYILNRTPNCGLDWATPFEMLTDRKPYLAHLRTIGCRTYVKYPTETRTAADKLQPRAWIGYLLGYAASNIWLIWAPQKKSPYNIIRARDVVFDETILYKDDPNAVPQKLTAAEIPSILPVREIVQPEALQAPERLAYRPPPKTPSNQPLVGELGNTGEHHHLKADQRQQPDRGRSYMPSPSPTPEFEGSIARRPPRNRVATPPRPVHSHEPLDDPEVTRLEQHLQRDHYEPPGGWDSTPIQPSPPPQHHPEMQSPMEHTDTTASKKTSRGNAAPNREAVDGDLRPEYILDTKRERKPRNLAASAINIDMVPFLSSWAIAVDYRGLDRLVAIDTGMVTLPYRSMSDYWPIKIDKPITALSVDSKVHGSSLPPPPKGFKRMVKHPHCDGFKNAAQVEWDALIERNTWEEIEETDVPAGEKLIPLSWVFTYKLDADGYLYKYKARLVARGDLQTKATMSDVYAYTLAISHFRILMAFIAAWDLEADQLDAINAFVNAYRERPAYCYFPYGFNPSKASKSPTRLKVTRALYGFCESPLDWYKEYIKTLHSMSFQPVSDEKCLWIHPERKVLIFFHVDDSIIAGKRHDIDAIKAELMEVYPMRDCGPVSWFLGIRVIRNRPERKIYLCQDAYIERMVHSLKHPPAPNVDYPLSPYCDLSPSTGEVDEAVVKEYQRLIGAINWAAVATRPDIAHAVSVLASHLSNPSRRHLNAAYGVLGYLYATRHQALCYSDCQSSGKDAKLWIAPLQASSDASFADLPGRCSSQGYLFCLFGGAVVWNATKQRTVTTSTTEAELMAVSAAARELIATIRFVLQSGFKLDQNIELQCDNRQTVDVINKPAPTLTTKLRHIDIHHHWLRQLVQSGQTDSGINNTIAVVWVDTASMPADGLTKRLSADKHGKFVQQLGMQDVSAMIT